MPALREELKGLLEEWAGCAVEMESAAAARDFELLSRRFREGQDFFRRLSRLIAKDGRSELKACKAEVESAVKKWQAAASLLPKWMEEMKRELDSVRKRKAVKSKIGSAYGGRAKAKRTAVNLCVKAR